MDGIFPVLGAVNDDVKIVATFGNDGDKLLVAGRFTRYIVHKGHIPVRGKGLRLIAARRFFRLGFRRGGFLGYGGRRVVAFIATARISGNRKAAHDNQCGKQYGKLSDYLFILHCRCPPVRRGKWLPAAAR